MKPKIQDETLAHLAKPATWTKMLDLCPIPNEAARLVSEEDNGGRLYAIPIRRPGWYRAPISWVFPMRRQRRIFLDPIGSSVFALCDGSRNVEEIIDTFADQWQLTFHEARVSITQYFRDLVERGLLAVALPEPNKKTDD